MREHEEILNMKIDTKIDDLKYEASRSINHTFYPLNSHNSHSSSNQPSADINKLPLLKSQYFHSHASQFTKHLSPITLQLYTLRTQVGLFQRGGVSVVTNEGVNEAGEVMVEIFRFLVYQNIMEQGLGMWVVHIDAFIVLVHWVCYLMGPQ